MSTPGWEGILDDDETILWQGQPVGGIDWSALIDVQTVFGLFFTGFAMFWVSMTADMTQDIGNAPVIFKFFPLFGLIFVGIGLNMVIGRHFWSAYQRHRTYYTLTNKAAYIATQVLGNRKLNRYGFSEMTATTLTDNDPGSVHFAEKQTTYTRRRNGRTTSGTYRSPVGFERISDARQVYRLLREARGKD
ncbi:hypothetical protein [Flavimaricola marinus]|uniref:DUF304 domain-containing protein n=1 Tax=Flavimaricola marinus TaxID=1819565 RepID=A0A238LB89_9RHOB|nr:hypothetical protein [Flavimaricola marinus]SMY06823.1 hypothetical protein LOM8899_00953 [Flavimaricola marinus]